MRKFRHALKILCIKYILNNSRIIITQKNQKKFFCPKCSVFCLKCYFFHFFALFLRFFLVIVGNFTESEKRHPMPKCLFLYVLHIYLKRKCHIPCLMQFAPRISMCNFVTRPFYACVFIPFYTDLLCMPA